MFCRDVPYSAELVLFSLARPSFQKFAMVVRPTSPPERPLFLNLSSGDGLLHNCHAVSFFCCTIFTTFHSKPWLLQMPCHYAIVLPIRPASLILLQTYIPTFCNCKSYKSLPLSAPVSQRPIHLLFSTLHNFQAVFTSPSHAIVMQHHPLWIQNLLLHYQSSAFKYNLLLNCGYNTPQNFNFNLQADLKVTMSSKPFHYLSAFKLPCAHHSCSASSPHSRSPTTHPKVYKRDSHKISSPTSIRCRIQKSVEPLCSSLPQHEQYSLLYQWEYHLWYLWCCPLVPSQILSMSETGLKCLALDPTSSHAV